MQQQCTSTWEGSKTTVGSNKPATNLQQLSTWHKALDKRLVQLQLLLIHQRCVDPRIDRHRAYHPVPMSHHNSSPPEHSHVNPLASWRFLRMLDDPLQMQANK